MGRPLTVTEHKGELRNALHMSETATTVGVDKRPVMKSHPVANLARRAVANLEEMISFFIHKFKFRDRVFVNFLFHQQTNGVENHTEGRHI